MTRWDVTISCMVRKEVLADSEPAENALGFLVFSVPAETAGEALDAVAHLIEKTEPFQESSAFVDGRLL